MSIVAALMMTTMGELLWSRPHQAVEKGASRGTGNSVMTGRVRRHGITADLVKTGTGAAVMIRVLTGQLIPL